MQEPTKLFMVIYYINRASIAMMLIGVAGFVIGAITRDNAPLALMAVMVVIGVLGIPIHVITYLVGRGMEVADSAKINRKWKR